MGQTFELEGVVGAGNGHQPDHQMVKGYMQELDDMRSTVVSFHAMDPSDILAAISGISGRLAEMRAQLQRVNSQRCSALRAREVDPLREELELQFKVHSRRIALMEWELKMSGGGI